MKIIKQVGETPFKGFHGWKMETSVEFDSGKTAKISTHKTHKGELVTSVSVGIQKDNCFSFTMFQDYYKVAMATSPKRVTAKVVENQHNSVMEVLEVIVEDIRKYYQ